MSLDIVFLEIGKKCEESRADVKVITADRTFKIHTDAEVIVS